MKQGFLVIATGLAIFTTSITAHAGTISAGISGQISAGANYTAPIDSAYVTYISGTTAYIQDATGAVQGFQMNKSGTALQAASAGIGTLLTGISTADGTGYFASFTNSSGLQQYEYTAANTTTVTYTSINTTGTNASIPSSYYTKFSNLSAVNPGSASAQGVVNSLVSFVNVSITSANGDTTFAANGTYTATDTSGNPYTVFVGTASGLVGTNVPTGPVDISGVLAIFQGTYELLPRGTFDLVAAPEPATASLLLGSLGLIALRRKRP